MKLRRFICIGIVALLAALNLFPLVVAAEPVDGDGIVTIPDEESVFGTMILPEPISAALGDFPNDPEYSKQWNTVMVRPEDIYSEHIFGREMKIAIVDSGSPSKHPDIGGNIVLEADFTYNHSGLYDSYGHCTFISGIIGADTNNRLGIAGVLPEVSIYSLRGLEGRNGYISDISNAIMAAVDTYHCGVINLSFTAPVDYLTLGNAVKHAVDNGVIVVAASGNKSAKENGTELMYPAAYEGVIGVGSIDRNKQRSSFSHYNSSVDVCAPGENVYSTMINGGYGTGRGTSYAAPYVSAAAAVAKYYDPHIDSEGFTELLAKTCEPLGGAAQGERNDEYGYGMIDFHNIVSYYKKNTDTEPSSAPEPVESSEPSESSKPGEVVAPNYPAFIDNFDVSESDEETNISFTIDNHSGYPVDGDAYICIYDDSMILRLTEVIENINIQPNDNGLSVNENIKIPADAASCKIFFWSDNFSPLAAAYENHLR